MANIVRAALVQSAWTGDMESMIERSIELAKEAAADGAQVPNLKRKSQKKAAFFLNSLRG